MGGDYITGLIRIVKFYITQLENKIMVYSDVIKNNYHKLLPVKLKYTMRDVDKVLMESFFNSNLNHGVTFTIQESKFIVKCTSIFNNTECSKAVYKNNNKII